MTPPRLMVGLTAYSLARDPISRCWYPVIPDDPGVIHAIRPAAAEPWLTDPYFIEDTNDYRAGICGALVKVVVPLSFKPKEAGACPECLEEIAHPSKPPQWLGNPFQTSMTGDTWWGNGSYKHPGWQRRRREERAARGPVEDKRTPL